MLYAVSIIHLISILNLKILLKTFFTKNNIYVWSKKIIQENKVSYSKPRLHIEPKLYFIFSTYSFAFGMKTKRLRLILEFGKFILCFHRVMEMFYGG